MLYNRRLSTLKLRELKFMNIDNDAVESVEGDYDYY